MEQWTVQEIFAKLHVDEMRRQAVESARRSEAGGLRRLIARRLIRLGLRLDADAMRDVTRANGATTPSNASDA